LHECFAGDEVEANGQTFLFRPRPPRPPIIVGGAPPHAIRRAVRFGEGWMPTSAHAELLETGIASLHEGMAAAGKPAPEIVLLQPLPVENDERLASRLGELAALGVTRVVHPWRYRDAEEVARVAARLVAARDAYAASA
jgi:alkanesulfonate monooxygenase SsuD/methylene tetrahydromethanopterin reductase-like flavin-dependent oxidoreductase (luciferase family)